MFIKVRILVQVNIKQFIGRRLVKFDVVSPFDVEPSHFSAMSIDLVFLMFRCSRFCFDQSSRSRMLFPRSFFSVPASFYVI